MSLLPIEMIVSQRGWGSQICSLLYPQDLVWSQSENVFTGSVFLQVRQPLRKNYQITGRKFWGHLSRPFPGPKGALKLKCHQLTVSSPRGAQYIHDCGINELDTNTLFRTSSFYHLLEWASWGMAVKWSGNLYTRGAQTNCFLWVPYI